MQSSHLNFIESRITLLKNTLGLSYLFVSEKGESTSISAENECINPLYKHSNLQAYQDLVVDHTFYSFPRIRKTIFFEYYLIIPISFEDTFLGNFIIGPTIPLALSTEFLDLMINDYDAFPIKNQVLDYYQKVPILSLDEVYKLATMLYALFTNKVLLVEDVKQQNLEQTISDLSFNHPQVREQLQQKKFHNRKFENTILSVVRSGNTDALKPLKAFKSPKEVSLYSKKSLLRSLKNHVITLIALVSRVAIESGVSAEEAIGLSDSYIIKLDDIHSIEKTRNLAREMIFTYTKKVKDVNQNSYSRLVNDCREYIYRHVFESIKQEQIAQYVSVSPSYLSTLFKKETGDTLTDYIQKAKIKEAQNLLLTSDLSLSEISNTLSFSDQSYFTKTFKSILI